MPTNRNFFSPRHMLRQQILGDYANLMEVSLIPQTEYDSLLVVIEGRTDGSVAGVPANEGVAVRFDGDSLTHYQFVKSSMLNTVTTPKSDVAVTSIIPFQVPNDFCTPGMFGSGMLFIPNYAKTDRFKRVHFKGGFAQDNLAANQGKSEGSGLWNSMAPIDRITVTPQTSAQWAPNSSITVYGMEGPLPF